MSASSCESGEKSNTPRKKGVKNKNPPKVPAMLREPAQEAAQVKLGSENVNTMSTTAKAAEVTSTETATVAKLEAVETNSKPALESAKELCPASTSKAAQAVKQQVPKLKEVVKAASNIQPVPSPKISRPALSSKSPNVPANVPSTSVSSYVATGPSFAQQVGGTSNKSHIEIQGKFVAPRPPPSAGNIKPKSDEGLQGVFNSRWQDDRYGMHFEHIQGSAQSAYLKALAAVVPRESIFSFGLIGRGLVEVYTTSLESATKLMLEGIEVGGRHLSACPVTVRPTRVTFSRVPMRTDHGDLITFLKRFGTVHGRVRAIPLRVGEEGLGRGIFSTSREAFISLNKGCVLPDGFWLNVSGSRSWIKVETEAKCHACHQVGHFVAECPKKAKKIAEVAAKEQTTKADASTTALTPATATAPNEQASGSVGKTAERVNVTPPAPKNLGPLPENVSSSDEGTSSSRSSKKRLTKRKQKSKDTRKEMPPPPKPVEKGASKRSHPGEEGESRSRKVTVVETEDLAVNLPDSEISMDEAMELISGYESCNSATTIKSTDSRLETTPETEAIPPERLRLILERLHSKKNEGRILTILQQELEDPGRILPSLLALQRKMKKKADYNGATRIGRLYNKIQRILENGELDGSLRH